MKVTFIGGGSLRLLGILRGALAERGILQNGEIFLHDLNLRRAEAMARMVMKTPECVASGCEVKWGTDLAAALDGADMVGVILMAGSAGSYERGADACYRHGFIPSDNISPNGAFLAIKGSPILLNIAKQMQRYCPAATLVDFANPIAVLSGMLNNHTPIRTIGVCAGFTNHQWDLSRLLGKDEQGDFDVDVAGVNHLSFIVRGTHKGKDLLGALRRRTARNWKMPALNPGFPKPYYKAIPAGLRVVIRMMKELGVLIFSTEGDGMMHLHYDEVLADRLKEFRTPSFQRWGRRLKSLEAHRGQSDAQFRATLDVDLDQQFWTDGWRELGFDWAERKDRDIFVEVMRGLAGVKRVKVVTSRPNNGAVAGFTDRTVLEYSQLIDCGEITAAGRFEIPASVHGLTASLAAHQTMLGDALATEDPRLLAQALLCYPVQPYSRAARSLYKELAGINRDQIPKSLRSLGDYL